MKLSRAAMAGDEGNATDLTVLGRTVKEPGRCNGQYFLAKLFILEKCQRPFDPFRLKLYWVIMVGFTLGEEIEINSRCSGTGLNTNATKPLNFYITFIEIICIFKFSSTRQKV